ncbi:MAG: ABC transporter ATP-binding protein [Solirubrobacterales bacterium]
MGEAVISVSGLRKSYDDLEAVRGIDLEVERGEVFAFLGPNGAGKTTTVEILEGYRERSGGEVRVLGEDPAEADREWHERVGIVLQQCSMPPELTVRETIELYAGYYRAPRSVEETIALVGLESKSEARTGSLSGGQQRRLDVALALVGDPELLFLDEPTTGFDPTARRQAWDVIGGLKDLDKTVFLTTHYMEEAQVLAERVAIIARGQIVASGAPSEIGGRDRAATRIEFRLPESTSVGDLPVEVAIGNGGLASVNTENPTRTLNELTGWALERGSALDGLEVRQPSLEDVYLALTDAAASDEHEEGSS